MALCGELLGLLSSIRDSRGFNVDAWLQEKVSRHSLVLLAPNNAQTTLFNDYMRRHGLKAAVISVSGGVDSAVIMAMCAHAMKQPGSPIQKVTTPPVIDFSWIDAFQLVGVAQPIHSTDSIWKRALLLEKYAPVVTVDQSAIHDLLVQTVDQAVGITGGSFATGQLRSYQRTPVGYYTAQLLSQSGFPCVVMGTGNYGTEAMSSLNRV
jgi:NAD+ synthase (glutamine-hydrolysing)